MANVIMNILRTLVRSDRDQRGEEEKERRRIGGAELKDLSMVKKEEGVQWPRQFDEVKVR